LRRGVNGASLPLLLLQRGKLSVYATSPGVDDDGLPSAAVPLERVSLDTVTLSSVDEVRPRLR
jgi:hypothetical protein